MGELDGPESVEEQIKHLEETIAKQETAMNMLAEEVVKLSATLDEIGKIVKEALEDSNNK